ncbi:MAG: DinB family protein [Candidatus Korobacteraceae bacterium]
MSEIDRILKHYDSVLNGEAWHGDPIWQILDGVSAETAAARPPFEGHSIWEIVMHMTFWEGVATKRLQGERAGLVEELNFPPIPAPTEENWQRTLDAFRASNRAFRDALVKLDPARLDDLTAAGKRSFYSEAHGAIEHSVYHAGQLALLSKIATSTAV